MYIKKIRYGWLDSNSYKMIVRLIKNSINTVDDN